MWLGYNSTGAMCDQCWEWSVFWLCSCMVSVSIPHQHRSDPQSPVWSHTLKGGGGTMLRSTVQTHFNGMRQETCSWALLYPDPKREPGNVANEVKTGSNSIKHTAFFTYLPGDKPRGLAIARAVSDQAVSTCSPHTMDCVCIHPMFISLHPACCYLGS